MADRQPLRSAPKKLISGNEEKDNISTVDSSGLLYTSTPSMEGAFLEVLERDLGLLDNEDEMDADECPSMMSGGVRGPGDESLAEQETAEKQLQLSVAKSDPFSDAMDAIARKEDAGAGGIENAAAVLSSEHVGMQSAEQSVASHHESYTTETPAAAEHGSAPQGEEHQSPDEGNDEVSDEEKEDEESGTESAHDDEVDKESEFRRHKKHIFMLSSAGKPIFTRYGDESDFSELFGVLQVLISMAQHCPAPPTMAAGSGGTAAGAVERTIRDNLRRVTAGSDQSIYFHADGEVYLVMVCKNGEGAKSCMRQLRLVHAHLLSVVPNVNDILRRSPGYDVRKLFSPADVAVLKELIKANSAQETFLMRAVSAAPLVPERRRFVEAILSMQRLPPESLASIASKTLTPAISAFGPTALSTATPAAANQYADQMLDEEEEADEARRMANGEVEYDEAHEAVSHLFSFILFRGRVVAAVGPAGEASKLPIDDMLILLNFTHYLCSSQAGEVWAPVCLPKFNNSGYLWCYCGNLSVMAREMQHRHQQLKEQFKQHTKSSADLTSTSTPKPPTTQPRSHRHAPPTDPSIAKGEGLLIVQLATSQDAFSKLSFRSRRVARLLRPLIPDLEAELIGRWSFSCAVATSAQTIPSPPSSSFIPRTTTLQGRTLSQPTLAGPPPLSHSSTTGTATADGVPSVSLSPPSVASDGLLYFACTTMPGIASAAAAVGGNTPATFSAASAAAQAHRAELESKAKASSRGKGANGLSSNPAQHAQLIASSLPPQMAFNKKERKRILRMFVKLRDKLGLLLRSSAPLLLCRVKEYSFVIVRPSPTFFLTTSVPLKATPRPILHSSPLSGQSPSQHQSARQKGTPSKSTSSTGVSASGVFTVSSSREPDMDLAQAATSALTLSGICEMMLLFSPSASKETIVRCIAKFVRNVQAREAEYTFEYTTWKSMKVKRR